MKIFLTILTGALLLSAPAFALDGVATCDLHGYSTDTDPKGTNIRSAPSATASIVGHIPSEQSLGQNSNAAAQFDILGSKDGWLLIQNVTNGGDPDAAPKTFYKGQGWVSGALVGFTVGSYQLRSGPDKASKVVAQLVDESKGQGADSWAVKRVYACQGSAADISVLLATDPHAKPIRGWASRLCQDQLTTCDPN